MIPKPVNTTLPATGAGAAMIALPATQSCEDYTVQARGAVDIKISDVEALTTYFTLKSGTAILISEMLGAGAAFFWAESGSAADVVEVLPLMKNRP